ncbi:MAG: HDOD domain-containing protein [Rhodocyclaceae bacterium]|nr:HDOD domain-containing protein [Rhodocyclaceae bacterium]
MVEHPFEGLDAWIAYFRHVDVPVLRHTLQEMERLRENAETVNGRVLAAVILRDPMMTLRVLAYIEEHRRQRQNADITTIERALMMIGVDPFFRDFRDLPVVENQLRATPRALLGLLQVIGRARKAAHWAREWAILRHDLDVDEITVAALLHDLAEILMWCFAPNLALRVQDAQARDRNLRSAVAQEDTYNIRLQDLQLALAREFHLPELLTTLMNRSNAGNPRVKTVVLAVDMARHSAHGWDDAALPDDFHAVEELLHLSHENLLRKLGLDADEAASRNSED